ncbi:unnamed protein product [Bursaphelenchus xylophilus]|nr:unnamed protein product [Bursaphelenchus xylophilus]CAG9086949.1 unnamed protein product [Bursaphelenchus xylophilus]
MDWVDVQGLWPKILNRPNPVVTAVSDKPSWSHRYAAEFGNRWCRDLGRSAEVLFPLRAAMSGGPTAGTKLRRVNEVPNVGNVAKARLYTAVVRYGSGLKRPTCRYGL